MRKIFSIVFLSITLCGDSMLNLMLMWTILERQGSVVHLGITICIMSIFPYLLQKYVKPLKTMLSSNPLLVFAVVRILGILMLELLFFLFDQENIYTYYVVGGVFACVFFLSMQSLEAYMSQKVLEGKVDSSLASNQLQAAIQIGAFAGNSLTGVLLALGGIEMVGLILSMTLLIGVGIPLILPLLSHQSDKVAEKVTKPVDRDPLDSIQLRAGISKDHMLRLTVIGVTLLTVQLASINFLLPIIFHDVYDWSSVQYGVVGAAMGLGAFIATVLGRFGRFVPYASFGLILVIDALLGTIENWSLAIFLGFSLGLVFNRFRIYQRILMFKFLETKEETVIWSGRTTTAFQFTKALTPLLLVYPLAWLGVANAGILLAIMGVLLTSLLGIIYWFETRGISHDEQEEHVA